MGCFGSKPKPSDSTNLDESLGPRPVNGAKTGRKSSIADSGPFTVEQDRNGNYITKENPHWPNDDSWTRENVQDGNDKTRIPGGLLPNV